MLVGAVLFVSLQAVSDVGITGLLGAKHEAFTSQQGQFAAYTLYLMTFALDSVGDIFGSLFALATGLLVIRSGVLSRWLGLVSILVGILFFLQGFGLGGVIALFGLMLDLIGCRGAVRAVVHAGYVRRRPTSVEVCSRSIPCPSAMPETTRLTDVTGPS